MAAGPAGAQRGESQTARSPPPPLGRPLSRPGRGEWPGASRRSRALRRLPALCSRAHTGAVAEARTGGDRAGQGPAAAGQLLPSSLRRTAAAGAPLPRGEPTFRSVPRDRRRRGRVEPGEVARALFLSRSSLLSLAAALEGLRSVRPVPLCRGPPGSATTRVGQRGLQHFFVWVRKHCGENPRTVEVAQGGGDSAVATGSGGRERACKISSSNLPHSPRTCGQNVILVHPRPVHLSGPQLFPGPLVL